ncbi:uncharacterized protein VICG_00472 [Vittaforma corneae ATCC 50505]|uniref:Uncharacterized protein n=1 Tax=Vittaforma corneae (strain ATCC 50505) TaxID=993615 RepID=L2GP18_VITCO|nr:uncharacterized protein VICG_00472 [Vittaforma corneae ATCC 50505]ELA42374.1 hypothetical protein VICG_00472 [Vittaforma corneae ATCC 50505]
MQENDSLMEHILEILIKSSLYIGEVIDKIVPSDWILGCIWRNRRYIAQGKEWTHSVSKMLAGMGATKMPEMYITLVSEFCDTIPKLVFKLEDEHISMHLAKMFVVMMHKGVITTAQCSNYLKNIQKKCAMLGRLDIVLSGLEWIDPEDIICNGQMDGEASEAVHVGKCTEVDFELAKHLSSTDRPDSQSSNGIDLASQKMIHPSIMLENFSKPDACGLIKDACKDASVDGSSAIEAFPFFLDFPSFKGILEIEANKLVLAVDILEKTELLRYSIEFSSTIQHEDEISLEGKYTLFELTVDLIGRRYTVEIGNHKYHGVFGLQCLVKPQALTFQQFEEACKRAENSIGIDIKTIEQLDLYRIDSQRFAGCILGYKVLIRKKSGGAELKGDGFVTNVFGPSK